MNTTNFLDSTYSLTVVAEQHNINNAMGYLSASIIQLGIMAEIIKLYSVTDAILPISSAATFLHLISALPLRQNSSWNELSSFPQSYLIIRNLKIVNNLHKSNNVDKTFSDSLFM
ncbi:hypothetical protein AVEN_249947-1 [Araneus ventricosus]|uniref:Uncharacterized protein n=1 Tax=Araneus ventricosus TaxID=182803 RepID=A0A4Y2VET8_ARAVE|nr:hypothetical protein AVEN_249947-1 [Araneus ventricosus]